MDIENKSINPSILIVDDSPSNLKLLANILTKKGYQIHPAISGQLALRHIDLYTPDLIVLDINMPDMNGYELCKKIKTNSRFGRTPVIFISALNEVNDKVKGFDAGGVDYIVKPVQEADVLARIETHLTLWNLQKQLNLKNIQLQNEIREREKIEKKILEAYSIIEIQIQERTEELRMANLELIKKESKVRGILNAIPDLLFVLDKEGNFTEYISRIPEMLYIPPNEFLKKNILDVMPDYIAKLTIEKIKEVIETEKTQIFEYDFLIENTKKYFEAHMAISEQEHVVCIVRDITARKTVEKAIKKANDELESKIEERTKDLVLLNHKLDELSRTDPLTGLANRRALLDRYEMERSQAMRKNTTFALIMGDIDFFKTINDTYGHECGDAILKQLADLFKRNIRSSDIVSRYGGEEFVIMLSEINESAAWNVVEKLRRKIENNVFLYNNLEIKTRVSFGVGIFSGDSTFTNCILIIDQCLYDAKSAGRNKTVIRNIISQ